MTERVSEADLHALIDGELPPPRRAAVEAALAADPALAARAAAWRADKAAVRAAFAPLADAPVPAALLAAARAGPARPAAVRRRVPLALASAALAAALAFAFAPREPAEPAVTGALAARGELLAPARRLDGADPEARRAADAALSGMLGAPVRAPDLARAGFALVAAETYGAAGPDAVQLRYEDAARRLFTVYLLPSDGPDAFQVSEHGGVRVCVWRNADVTAVMTGEMSTPELFRLASLAYASLGL